MDRVDILIIGQGPAGLSAAIYAGRAGMKTRILGCDPKVAGDYTIDNYFGFPEPLTGKELIERGVRQAKKFGVGRFLQIAVAVGEGALAARAVIGHVKKVCRATPKQIAGS
ncbi:MAG: NAD(P)/FAD-dependent oxidoreductase [Desulfobacterales bacterium]|nr:NAD(P)/FAD-dependent oxidoreductase [Desulfobacterales bacterium]